MPQATVGKWGKTLAIRFPGEVVRTTQLREGERVEIEAHEGEIVIRRAAREVRVEELFRGKTPEEWRALYRGAFDWGPDLGRECVEE